MAQHLPYGARTVEEMERNQARLGDTWQERERTWDERFGYVQRPMPLLPWVFTGGTLVVIVGLLFLLSGCADYACAPARWQGYSCPSPAKALAERR